MIVFFYILISLNPLLHCCIDSQKQDAENLACIQLLEKKQDISQKNILDCSSMTVKDNWVGYLCMCRINRIKKNLPLAQSFCLKAKEKNPFSADVYNEIAMIYIDKKNIDAAITEVEFALNISSNNFLSNFLAAQLLENKNTKKSLFFYKNALNIIKKSKDIYIIGKKEKVEERIKELEQRVKIKDKKANEEKYNICINQYKKEKNPQTALNIIKSCIKISKNKELMFDYIKLLYLNSEYEKAIDEIKKNKIENFKNKNDIYLILADSYYKKGDLKNSIKYYKELDKMQINEPKILLKYAQILEEDGDKINAIDIYKRIYSLTPNKDIYEKIELLKVDTMGKDEIMADLKLRNMIEKEKITILPNDKKLFLSVKLIERKGAIDWLTKTYPGYANIIVNDNNQLKIMNEGYKLYLKYISQKAIKLFQKNNIEPKYLFELVDENGNKIFDKKGNLTYEGLIAYYNAVETNKKTYFLADEVLPKKPEFKQSYEKNEKEFDKIKKKLTSEGYDEISEDEYLFLIKKTNCPESVLLNYPCNLKKIKINNKNRYFACSDLKCANDPPRYTAITLYTYIVSYREGNNNNDGEDSARNFFGSTTHKRRFCEDGKIWEGPEFRDDDIMKMKLQKDLEKIIKYKEKMKKLIESYSPKPK